MTRKIISEAIGNISDRHIEEVISFQEKQSMKNTKEKKIVWSKRWPAAAAAAAALFVCISGTTALAAAGALPGFFEDIFGWNGAVVGTSYRQASDELHLRAAEVSDKLVVEMIMTAPDKAPYRELESLGIRRYQILDGENQVIAEEITEDMAPVTEGKAYGSISLKTLEKGDYKLIVTEMVGGKKADQLLILSGVWECVFTK